MNIQVVIYSRVNCHLCQQTENNVREVMVKIPFELEVIYIDGDQELERLYGEEVPVTVINGEKHDYFTVDKFRLAKSINSLIHSD
jgi:glutaredoxin